jgi:hypothetical protein
MNVNGRLGLSSVRRAPGDMARSRDNPLWALVHAERYALAQELSGLDGDQWRHSTLCGQWDVEEVVADRTAAARA